MRSAPIDIRNRAPYSVDQFRVNDEYEEDIESILVCEGEIENRIERLAEEISRDYRNRSGEGVLLICVLKGALRFFGVLSPHLRFEVPVRESIVRASRYDGGEPGAEQADVRLLDNGTIEDMDVLVVEDLIDAGYTLETILTRLEERDPNSVDVAVLFDKVASRETDIDAAYTGFVIPDEFVVGFGIDYDERYRNVRHLGVLTEAVMEA